MNNSDLDVTKKQRLIGIKKYQRYVGQIEIKFDQLYDQILVLAIFLKNLHKVYDNKKVIINIKVR